jgi:hypothetical protein
MFNSISKKTYTEEKLIAKLKPCIVQLNELISSLKEWEIKIEQKRKLW